MKKHDMIILHKITPFYSCPWSINKLILFEIFNKTIDVIRSTKYTTRTVIKPVLVLYLTYALVFLPVFTGYCIYDKCCPHDMLSIVL